MKKWIAPVIAAVIALSVYTAAGPYLTMRAIATAVQNQDAAALSRQVDFIRLRGSVKAQLADRIVREAGIGASSNPFAAFGMAIASGVAGGAVDMLVTPNGIAALTEGRKVWDRASGVPMPGSADAKALAPKPRPFADAVTRYESTSRFTATVTDDDGRPIVFVLTRHGMAWKLSDVRLPL